MAKEDVLALVLGYTGIPPEPVRNEDVCAGIDAFNARYECIRVEWYDGADEPVVTLVPKAVTPSAAPSI